MKKKFLLGAIALASAIVLASCDSAATITDASGSTINVTKTNDSAEVAKALDALENVKTDTSNITCASIKENVYFNIDTENGDLYTKVKLDENGDLYSWITSESESLVNFYLNSNIKLDYHVKEKSSLGLVQTNELNFDAKVNAFNKDNNVYASWSGLNLGDEFPNEAKAYLSYPTIKNIIDNILENANVSSSEIDLDAIIAKLKKEYSTKEICEKLGITISSTSSNEIEFSINCSIKDLYDMLSKVDSQMSSQLEGMVETIGSARLVLYVRVNVTNNLPVKVEAKLEGIKEAMQNALASNDDKTKVNAADFNFKLEFAYDATIPTLPDTKDYVPFNDLFKK